MSHKEEVITTSLIGGRRKAVNYHTHKFAAEQDLFYNILHFSGSHSCSIFQIGDTDLFYAPFYFSDGTLTDINIYYLKSEKLRNALKDTRVIRFSPGTGEWLPMKGDLKDTHAWFFISRIVSTTSGEIQEIFYMEDNFQNFSINEALHARSNPLIPKPD